ncbi:DUF6886 family protein [Phenylobacterium sp.]|uniref:DUF6886 family protein n=1 Tax=Phenylobacterium sp. TaxID=1871053 RepID=UPI002732D4A3|nr:DUF6886 family protein [Phenylobacterium sp.]MDP3854871.1 hypothetical protein [Phenylobacterium sp.]
MTKPRLFHVSEEAGIAQFDPRPPPSTDSGVRGDCVWAVDEDHLVNYLLPRDCPRITYGRGPETTDEDAARFLTDARRVVAFEAAWLERVLACPLRIYEFPTASFNVALADAGYWISREPVIPLEERVRANLVEALIEAGAEVRVLQDFWPLSDAVAASSLEFSIIRKRNAQPRL